MNTAHGTCAQTLHQPHHAARTAPHHPRVAQAGDALPIQFVGHEPVAPTAPLADCVPLSACESRQVMVLVACWLVVACAMVMAGIGYMVAVVMALAVAVVWARLDKIWAKVLP